jgi:Holliday junction resolvase-like predicted endonuclease
VATAFSIGTGALAGAKFVEVRVRTGEHFGTADESVDRAKLSRLMAAGATYVSTHPSVADAIWRVDLVAVTLSPSGAVRAYNHYQNLTLD